MLARDRLSQLPFRVSARAKSIAGARIMPHKISVAICQTKSTGVALASQFGCTLRTPDAVRLTGYLTQHQSVQIAVCDNMIECGFLPSRQLNETGSATPAGIDSVVS
jgi:hypothetical protein